MSTRVLIVAAVPLSALSTDPCAPGTAWDCDNGSERPFARWLPLRYAAWSLFHLLWVECGDSPRQRTGRSKGFPTASRCA